MREIMNYLNVLKYQCPKSSWTIIVTYIDKTHQKLFLLTLFKRAKPGHGKQKIWKGNDLNLDFFAGPSTPQF